MIQSVTNWLITKQSKEGFWKGTSKRPPTQGSHFTTTYLALRALSVFGTADQQEAIERANNSAAAWLVNTEPTDTEDLVFQLLSFDYVTVDDQQVQNAIDKLKQLQRDDGGWAQLPELESDAYATATALFALRQVAAIPDDDPAWTRGIRLSA